MYVKNPRKNANDMDILLTIILIFFKFTISPDMSWWLVLSPILVTFIVGFIRGHYDGSQRKYKE